MAKIPSEIQDVKVPSRYVPAIAALAEGALDRSPRGALRGLDKENPLYPAIVHLVHTDIVRWMSRFDDLDTSRDELVRKVCQVYVFNYDDKSGRILGDALYDVVEGCVKNFLAAYDADKQDA